jgi:hypothetical protein
LAITEIKKKEEERQKREIRYEEVERPDGLDKKEEKGGATYH